MSDMSGASCRMYRELLGVYVVGAIEPHERAAMDEHLTQCYECREELAGLAPLPALLRRVPLAEAERIAAARPDPYQGAEPTPELLDSLLARTAAKRRSTRVRAIFAVAAALLIAVGGAAAVTESLSPPSHAGPFEVSAASVGNVTATVRYGASSWGTAMSVRVAGVPQWTNCKFYVVTKDGRRVLAGTWSVGQDGGRLWYPVATAVPKSRLSGFVLVASHQRTLHIAADG
jgi:Putative zinc-finger